MFTGRHWSKGVQHPGHVENWYCSTELEELYLTALEPYDFDEITHTVVMPPKRPESPYLRPVLDLKTVGIFLGTHSVGGYDNGFRAFSMQYLSALIACLSVRYRVVVFGTSDVKTEEEMRRYREIVSTYSTVIDMVDRTSLKERAIQLAPVHTISGSQLFFVTMSRNVTGSVATACSSSR